MVKIRKYKCLGCKKVITLKKGERKRKYHNYECYAKASAATWGMTPKDARFKNALKQQARAQAAMALVRKRVG